MHGRCQFIDFQNLDIETLVNIQGEEKFNQVKSFLIKHLCGVLIEAQDATYWEIRRHDVKGSLRLKWSPCCFASSNNPFIILGPLKRDMTAWWEKGWSSSIAWQNPLIFLGQSDSRDKTHKVWKSQKWSHNLFNAQTNYKKDDDLR